MARRSHPTDLTDDEWRMLEPLIPPAKPGGCPRSVAPREVLNGIRSLLRSGGAWRLLPHELPPWPTVYASFRRWQADGTWERIAEALRRDLRVAQGRRPEPRGGPGQPDGQDHGKGGPRGDDAGKKTTGRKRHFLVDTEGVLTELVEYAANVSESAGAKLVLAKAQAAGQGVGRWRLPSGRGGVGAGRVS